MKYGEIKWKIEKVVFKAKDGIVTQKSEIDEGKTFIPKPSQPVLNSGISTQPVHPC